MMSNFFQSHIWRDLQHIFGRESFDFVFQEKSYWGVMRNHKVGPLSFSWYQGLGIHIDETRDVEVDIKVLRDDLSQRFGKSGDIFFQLGITNTLFSGTCKEAKQDKGMAVRQLREEKEHELREYKLLSGFRENMSLSTVHTPLNTPEELLASFHKGHRRDIKKATESDLQLIRATDDLREKYYTIWSDMATTKGIHIMSHTHFQQMKEYLQEHDAGDLFCAIDVNGEIVAGSIVAFEENMMTYLYGVKNRADTTTGSHTWLQYQIMIRGYEQGYSFFDHRGTAPSGYPDHPLVGVGRFKERFQGDKIEYWGNYDIVLSKTLYQGMKWKYKK